MLSTIDELPDLPGIEEEEETISPSCACFYASIGVFIPFILCWIIWNVGTGIVVAALIAFVIVLVGWLSSSKVHVNTDGLAYYRPYKHQFIKWIDVIGAQLTTGTHRCNILEISGSNGVISIPINGNDHPRIIAAIWQHLRRHGKAENFILSDNVLSMWAEIPDDIPEEQEYVEQSPEKPHWRIINCLCHDYISQKVEGASAKEMKTGHFSTNPRITNWSDVVDVSWDCDDTGAGLALITDNPNILDMFISCELNDNDEYDIDNARFLLAVVRRARQAIDKPIPIPEWLRDTCGIQLPGRQ